MSKPLNGTPDAAEYGLMRAYYAQLELADGSKLSQQEITDIIGSQGEFKRGEILNRNNGTEGVGPWCASLPKLNP